MILGVPPLDHVREFFRFRQNLRGLRFCSYKRIVIVNHVPLSPASVELITLRSAALSIPKTPSEMLDT